MPNPEPSEDRYRPTAMSSPNATSSADAPACHVRSGCSTSARCRSHKLLRTSPPGWVRYASAGTSVDIWTSPLAHHGQCQHRLRAADDVSRRNTGRPCLYLAASALNYVDTQLGAAVKLPWPRRGITPPPDLNAMKTGRQLKLQRAVALHLTTLSTIDTDLQHTPVVSPSTSSPMHSHPAPVVHFSNPNRRLRDSLC